jgi:VIT1/CCC1 family predicted Fe2+/Mn2+ transporter
MSDTTAYSKKTMRVLLYLQQGELTEHQIYSFLASRVKDEQNSSVLRRIAGEELGHAKIWQKLTEKEVKTNRIKFWFYSLMALILGYTFVLKKMEKGEDKATKAYRSLITEVPQAKQISEDEDRHEQQLLAMLDEERLQYVGSMVLGLSDALVELSALSGLITGISATLSMASSEYLSAKNSGDKNAVKSSMYTGIAYLFTVTFMVLPYLLLESYAVALGIMLVVVIIIIMFFTYYTSVAKDLPFGKRFFEMALISLSVAAISFVIGILVKRFLGIDI